MKRAGEIPDVRYPRGLSSMQVTGEGHGELAEMDGAQLHQLISTHFDIEELRTLCFDMNIDYDTLRGEGKDAKARELIMQCRRNSRIAELVARLGALRPNVAWDDIPATTPLPWGPFESTDDLFRQQYIERHNRIKRELRVFYIVIAILSIGAIVLSMALLGQVIPGGQHLWLLVVGWCLLGLAALEGLVLLINMTARSIKYMLLLRNVLEIEPDARHFELIRLPPTTDIWKRTWVDLGVLLLFMAGVTFLLAFIAVNLTVSH